MRSAGTPAPSNTGLQHHFSPIPTVRGPTVRPLYPPMNDVGIHQHSHVEGGTAARCHPRLTSTQNLALAVPVDGPGRGEAISRMPQAAKRLVATLANRAAPRVSDAHRQFPNGVRDGLDRTTRDHAQNTAEIDRTAPAAPADRGAEGGAPDSPGQERARRGGHDRFEISSREARELDEQARERGPDLAGNVNSLYRVDTSAGPAVVRFGAERSIETFLKKWMPENAAINYALEGGVRTPRIFYAGTDPATGKNFTIMQYIPGKTLGFDDPGLMNWLPDLLDQVRLTSARPLPVGRALDIPTWQQQTIRHADEAYHNLSPAHRSRPADLGLVPLSEYFRPDPSRSGEPTVFGHNDLYPFNLQLDEQGKVWILDWELAGPTIQRMNCAHCSTDGLTRPERANTIGAGHLRAFAGQQTDHAEGPFPSRGTTLFRDGWSRLRYLRRERRPDLGHRRRLRGLRRDRRESRWP